MVVAIGSALWLVFVWLGIAFVTVPLTLLTFAAGLVYGAGLAGVGYLRVYWGTEDERVLAGPDAAASRGSCAPYPRWDDGWPNYLSRQVERDVIAAGAWPRRQAHRLLADGLEQIWAYRSMLLAMLPVAPAPFAFLAGVLAGVYCGWALLAAAIESTLVLPRAARLAAIYVLRAIDLSLRWWHGAAVTCPRCRFTVALPAFRCDGTDCLVIHHDLRPGRLGVWARRCRCGAQLPTTILRAARTLRPACINCDLPLQSSAGVTPDARIIISGGPAVGKTRLLTQAIAEMPTWEPADDSTAAWLSNGLTAGTSALMLRRVANERLYYLHIVDLDGRHFQTDKNNSVLWQLGATRRHLLVLDATSVPRTRDRINPAAADGESGRPPWTDTSVAAAELPYRLLVRQLNRMGARTRRCSLALVITRADVLSAYGLAAGPDSAAGLKAWLRTIELHGLLAAAEHDFGSVRCFVIGAGRATPAEPFEWLLSLYPHGTSRP